MKILECDTKPISVRCSVGVPQEEGFRPNNFQRPQTQKGASSWKEPASQYSLLCTRARALSLPHACTHSPSLSLSLSFLCTCNLGLRFSFQLSLDDDDGCFITTTNSLVPLIEGLCSTDSISIRVLGLTVTSLLCFYGKENVFQENKQSVHI